MILAQFWLRIAIDTFYTVRPLQRHDRDDSRILAKTGRMWHFLPVFQLLFAAHVLSTQPGGCSMVLESNHCCVDG